MAGGSCCRWCGRSFETEPNPIASRRDAYATLQRRSARSLECNICPGVIAQSFQGKNKEEVDSELANWKTKYDFVEALAAREKEMNATAKTVVGRRRGKPKAKSLETEGVRGDTLLFVFWPAPIFKKINGCIVPKS